MLADVFGYKSFRSHQSAIVETLLAGGDALVLMPTGGGKSLCYQIPAMVRAGTGVVVSPLIALMQDQVDALAEVGVEAAFLNSTVDRATQDDIERKLLSGERKLLYVAPERLVQERTLSLLARARLALFAIDEAHCVSQWGHDFRPEYRQLRVLAERFPGVPRIALTATADERTRAEIAGELHLEDARQFVASFDRPNIRYTIAEMGSMGARERLWRFISEEHPDDAGIVYCLSRKQVDETAAWLAQKGRTTVAYHAGLPPETRRAAQTRFLAEDGLIVVATIAFGMGIDKPDVRFVAHLSLPKTIEAYYQETGRAGRDGEPANAWMAYGLQDLVQQRQWIAASDGSEEHRRVQTRKLDALIGLCETPGCRRQRLLAYFGETIEQPCGNCDNCLNPPETIDGTVLAQKALSAVYRTGERFGATYVIDVLVGKTDARIGQNRHDQLSVFGIGTDLDATGWRSLFRQLVAGGYLVPDDEGHNTLALGAPARAILKSQAHFPMRKAPPEARASGRAKGTRDKSSKTNQTVAPPDQALFAALRTLRVKLAKDVGVPPYVICHDRTLAELAARRPATVDALADISGLGTSRIAKYGDAFLEVIANHTAHPLLQNRLSATINQTLALHLAGRDAEAIATERGLDLQTILGHFAEAIEAGLVEARAVVGLEDEQIEEILSAFEDCQTLETGKLGPAHARLDGRFGYGALKCLLAELA